MNKELFKGLSEEQIAAIKNCKDNEEILAIAKKEGIELSDEQLAAVNGGCMTPDTPNCPRCNAHDIQTTKRYGPDGYTLDYKCKACGHEWTN